MDAQQTREALLEAVNVHDIDAVKSFIHPDYVAKNELGMVRGGYEGLMDHVTHLLEKHPDYRETLEVEDADEAGETAQFITRRTESHKGLFGLVRSRVVRRMETWKHLDGRWMMVEERSLS
jgi:hypothetical protein